MNGLFSEEKSFFVTDKKLVYWVNFYTDEHFPSFFVTDTNLAMSILMLID